MSQEYKKIRGKYGPEAISDCADVFGNVREEHEKDSIMFWANLKGVATKHNVEPEDRVEFFISGIHHTFERERMNAVSEFREHFQQMENMFK